MSWGDTQHLLVFLMLAMFAIILVLNIYVAFRSRKSKVIKLVTRSVLFELTHSRNLEKKFYLETVYEGDEPASYTLVSPNGSEDEVFDNVQDVLDRIEQLSFSDRASLIAHRREITNEGKIYNG